MDPATFGARCTGDLVPITGTDPQRGPWTHWAFLPHILPATAPELSSATHRVVGNARAALAALDSTARRLPNPRLLRRPALQTEAQSTSALEGTYAPLQEVLVADEEQPPNADVREVLNFVAMADAAFSYIEQGQRLTVGMLGELQGLLVRGTRNETEYSGTIRTGQVMIGRRATASPDDLPVQAARYVPPPPGLDLTARLQDLVDWMNERRSGDMDPVVAAAMAHYQFEALHPFHDGNGRIGRLMIVIHLLKEGVLSEPTLTVSPWFEAHRSDYYDVLLAVSTRGDWDAYTRFFAAGLEASARHTHEQMLALVTVQAALKDRVRASRLRADTAQSLVDFSVAHASFTIRMVERDLGISYGRANGLVGQLMSLGILDVVLAASHGGRRRFYAPEVLRVLLGRAAT